MPFKDEHPLYRTWTNMRQRCRNPRHPQWDSYGGRGIRVCERWDSFATFAADVGPRPEGYELDRIDNDGSYEPSNCRWATKSQQSRNTRITRRIRTPQGLTVIAADIADRVGVKTSTILDRAARGLPIDKVMSQQPLWNGIGIDKARAASIVAMTSKTHCKHGHEFTPENTFLRGGKYRICRACAQRRKVAHRAKISAVAAHSGCS